MSKVKSGKTITLQEPLQAYGEEVKSVTLRRPKGKDIKLCGFPVNAEQEVITKSIHRYIERLGNLPEGTVDELDPVDYTELMGAILDFFGESRPTSSSKLGTSPSPMDSTRIDC